jgi:hypothetical protein
MISDQQAAINVSSLGMDATTHTTSFASLASFRFWVLGTIS